MKSKVTREWSVGSLLAPVITKSDSYNSQMQHHKRLFVRPKIVKFMIVDRVE